MPQTRHFRFVAPTALGKGDDEPGNHIREFSFRRDVAPKEGKSPRPVLALDALASTAIKRSPPDAILRTVGYQGPKLEFNMYQSTA
jgi:hypothetical protein